MKNKGEKLPLAMLLFGMLIVLIVLAASLVVKFTLINLAYYLPALALAAFLIFSGRKRLKNR